ncbi:MAG: hypothetical protein AAGF11_30740 [Myxococcota bacterium]
MVSRSIGSLAVLLATGCPLDSSGIASGVGFSGGSGSGSTGGGDGGASSSTGNPLDGSAGSSTATTVATVATAAETEDGASTGPGCPPGDDGCPCLGDRCDAGLECVGGVCGPSLCGNGTVDLGELCDDGDREDGDGCQGDCTPTVGMQVVAGVAAGREHTCARLHDGEIVCWGNGSNGRLGYGNVDTIGDNTDEFANAGGFVDTGGHVVQLSLGSNFTCARFADGAVRCWGNGQHGRLGLGLGSTDDIGDGELPLDVGPIMLGGPAVDIAAGNAHVCAVLDGGDLLCWGQAQLGRLGYGSTNDVGLTQTPMEMGPVMVGGSVVQVVAGEAHTCALLVGGDVRCWGDNDVGQLGYGHSDDIGDDEGEVPAGEPPVVIADAGGMVIELAAGKDHTCAILEGGALRCWGDNGDGQLGYDHTNNIGDDADPALAGDVDVGGTVIGLALGNRHTCALLKDGSVKCWGSGGSGVLGVMTGEVIPPARQPIETGPVAITQLSAVHDHNCAYRADREVMCWGAGGQGRLGHGNTENIGDNETLVSVGTVMIIP